MGISAAEHASNRNPVMVELRVDLWVHPGGSDFLDAFVDTALKLKWDLDFVPHWPLFSLPQGDFNNQCTDRSAKYCAADPDGSGPITGRMVAEEAVRLACIRTEYGTRDPDNARNTALFAPKWFEYIIAFHKECTMDGAKELYRFGPECALRVGKSVGIDEDPVGRCVRAKSEDILRMQVEDVAWSPSALRINGWRYSGPHEATVVARAICSGYVIRPKVCDKIKADNPWKLQSEEIVGGTSVTTILVALLAAVSIFGIGLHCHRRHMILDVRSAYKGVVETEVRSSMAQYAQLQA